MNCTFTHNLFFDPQPPSAFCYILPLPPCGRAVRRPPPPPWSAPQPPSPSIILPVRAEMPGGTSINGISAVMPEYDPPHDAVGPNTKINSYSGNHSHILGAVAGKFSVREWGCYRRVVYHGQSLPSFFPYIFWGTKVFP